MAARFATAPDRTFPLNLKEFSTEIDPHTLTYQAVLVMPHPQDVNILPGMTATVEAKLEYAGENSTPRIVIPATAVTRDAKMAPYVWCLHEPDIEVSRRNVRIGELTGSDGIEILAGLKPGDRVVTAGVTKLRDGMKVAVWDESK
jgi:RND family efflux transporter MFP subunit